jgi:hypothetical protein
VVGIEWLYLLCPSTGHACLIRHASRQMTDYIRSWRVVRFSANKTKQVGVELLHNFACAVPVLQWSAAHLEPLAVEIHECISPWHPRVSMSTPAGAPSMKCTETRSSIIFITTRKLGANHFETYFVVTAIIHPRSLKATCSCS